MATAAKLGPQARAELLRMLDHPDTVELLADLEHDQWMAWSRMLEKNQPGLSADVRRLWRAWWRPYVNLPEAVKDQSRMQARAVIAQLRKLVG